MKVSESGVYCQWTEFVQLRRYHYILMFMPIKPINSRRSEGPVKVFLDDERNTPQGWVRVYWPEEAIELLKSGKVTDISLDHYLGDDRHGTGYDVVLWIEEAVIVRGFKAPNIQVHSSNPSARVKMELGIEHIKTWFNRSRL